MSKVADKPKAEKTQTPAEKAKAYANPGLALTAKPLETTVDIDGIVRLHKLQMRKGGTNEARVALLAEHLKGGAALPPVKIIQVDEYPGGPKAQGPYKLLFDGFHTTAAYENNGKKMIPVQAWKGTWEQALIAASKANKEHDTAGLPRTNEDKVKAAKMYLEAVAEMPKKERPSNREIAEEIGCSRQLVNELVAGTNEIKKAAKKIVRAKPADKADEPTPPVAAKPVTPAEKAKAAEAQKMIDAGMTPFNVVGKTTGQTVGTIYSKDPPTHESVKDKFPNLGEKDYVVKAGTAAPVAAAATSPKPPAGGFDWVAYDERIGYLARGLDALGDLFDMKKTPEFAGARRLLNDFITFVADTKKKHGPKKAGK